MDQDPETWEAERLNNLLCAGPKEKLRLRLKRGEKNVAIISGVQGERVKFY